MVMGRLSVARKTLRCWSYVLIPLMGLREALKGYEALKASRPRMAVESEMEQLS